MKIVIIGAGSESFGRGQIVDVLTCKELARRPVTMALVDLDPAKLRVMTALARRVAAKAKSDVRIQTATDYRKALAGADYVILAVARKRYPLWEQDYRVPMSHGLRHVLGENGGPGAIFHALRSLELVMPICRDMERLCPDALLLNFTNPEARVLHAVLTLTKVKAVGLCHGVFTAIEYLGRYLRRRPEDLHVVSAGINHFYCVLKAIDRKTGKDRLAEALRLAVADPKAPHIFRKIAEVFGVFTFPSDDHIGEYLAYGWEATAGKWIYGQERRPVPAADRLPESWLRAYATGAKPLDASVLRPSGELAVPVICDIELDRKSHRSAVNVLNTGGLIANLPHTAAVEVPAVVDRAGVHPQAVGPLPEPFAAYVRTQTSIIELVTEAWRTRSRRLLLQALLLDPCVNSIPAAEKTLDEMLALQAQYLPRFR